MTLPKVHPEKHKSITVTRLAQARRAQAALRAVLPAVYFR